MTADVLALSDDLIFFSRIMAECRAVGLAARQHRNPLMLAEAVRAGEGLLVLLDLAFPGLDVAKVMADLAGVRVVGYGPHVEAEMLREARKLGCDPVLPRSKFVEELPKRVREWAGSAEPEK